MLYYESHITIDPVVNEIKLAQLEQLIKPYGFRLAKLLMRKDLSPSTDDSFITAKYANLDVLKDLTMDMVIALKEANYTVRRYKIEEALIDSKIDDSFNLINSSQTITFIPDIKYVGYFDSFASIEEMAKEPRLAGIPLHDAMHLGGKLTRRVLLNSNMPICPEGLHPIVDTRVHRLMPGMYPAIPGWHCDDWPRATYNSQPNPALRNPSAKHFTAVIETTESVSNTEFVNEPINLTINKTEPVWKQVHKQVEKLKPPKIRLAPGVLTQFDGSCIHRATSCYRRGWRYWIRISWMHKPPEKVLTPSQEQVYILSEENGW